MVASTYLAYISNTELIEEVGDLIDYIQENFTGSLRRFLTENAIGVADLCINLGHSYGEQILLAYFLFAPISEGKDNFQETSESIVKLANRMLNIDNKNLAVFGSGSGTLLVNSFLYNYPRSVYGIEENNDAYCIADLRLRLIGEKYRLEKGPQFSASDELFDSIFCEFTWKEKITSKFLQNVNVRALSEKYPELAKATYADGLYVANVLEHLNKNGRAFVVVPSGYTSTSGDYKLMRQILIDSRYVEGIVLLPEALYWGLGAAISILVLSKKKNDHIRMVDASEFVTKGRRINRLSERDIERIDDIFRDNSGSSISRTVKYDEIIKADYMLEPRHFLIDNSGWDNAGTFGSVIKNITRAAQLKASELDELESQIPTEYQYLCLSNIQDGIIDDSLQYLTNIEKKLEKYCIKRNDLILSKTSAPVKVAIMESTSEKKVLVNGNMYVIEIDGTKANPYYIKAFFDSRQGSELLDKIAVGTTIKTITVEALNNLVIPLPSLEEQNRIAGRYVKKLEEVKRIRKELNEARIELKNIFMGE